MVQAERDNLKAKNFELDFSNKLQIISDAGSCDVDHDQNMQISSPFNVSKFAKTVDAMTNEKHLAQYDARRNNN